MVPLGRLERPTRGLGNRCSIRLSYRGIIKAILKLISEPSTGTQKLDLFLNYLLAKYHYFSGN